MKKNKSPLSFIPFEEVCNIDLRWCWYDQVWWFIRYKIWDFLVFDIKFYTRRFYQRGIRGWAVSDTWNYDTYLAKVISEGIEHLQKNQMGIPGELVDRYKSDELAIKEWDRILSVVVKTFCTAEKIVASELMYRPVNNFTLKNYRSDLEFFKGLDKRCNTNTHVMTREESERFEEGFDLFKEFFFNFWD